MEFPEVRKFAGTIAENNGFQNSTIEVVPANAKGEGFLGEIYLVNIQNGTKKLNIIVKLSLTNPVVRDKFAIKGAYENEITFYTKIYTACKRFQNEKGFKNIYKGIPFFIESAIEDNYEVLALENLRLQNFEVRDKQILFDKLHIECVLKQYAHFHAVSMAFRDQQPEEFSKILLPLTNMWDEFSDNDSMKDISNGIFSIVKDALIEIGEHKLAAIYDKSFHAYIEDFKKYFRYEGEMQVVLHGDCWSNNIMFKYKDSKEGKIIEDVCLIDFQLVHFGSPVQDLCYFIYANASEEIYNNLDYYLKFYHDYLSSFLKELGSDVEKLYPMSLLKEEWKKYAILGLFLGINILKMKFTLKEDIIDLNDFSKMSGDAYASVGYDKLKFNKSTIGLVKHFNDLGIL